MQAYTERCFPLLGAAGRRVNTVLKIDLPALLRFMRDGIYIEQIVVDATCGIGDVQFSFGVGGKEYCWLMINIGGSWHCIKGVWIWILCFAPGVVAHPRIDGGVGYSINGNGNITVFDFSTSHR